MKPPRPNYDHGRPVQDVLPSGWLTAEEAKLLTRLAEGQLVLEIGSWLGRSTVAMARAAFHVVSVDHHRGSPEHGPQVRTLAGFLDNLEQFGVREGVSVCVMDASHLITFFKPSLFGLVFVDGGHDFGSVSRDLAAGFELMAPGGVIAVHDYRPSTTSRSGVVTSSWPQVVAAVDNFVARSVFAISERVVDIAVLRA